MTFDLSTVPHQQKNEFKELDHLHQPRAIKHPYRKPSKTAHSSDCTNISDRPKLQTPAVPLTLWGRLKGLQMTRAQAKIVQGPKLHSSSFHHGTLQREEVHSEISKANRS
jgi:hypothetical protein